MDATQPANVATRPNRAYVVAAAALILAGLGAGQLLVRADVSYAPAAGISVFAVLYVLAQGVERVVEIIIGAITTLDTDFAENRKRQNLAVLNARHLTDVTASRAAEAEAKTEEARLDLAVLAQGMAFSLSYCLVSYFEFGIFDTIGVRNMAAGADRVFTAVAVMGGAKGLHDLIGKIQKSKEANDTASPAA